MLVVIITLDMVLHIPVLPVTAAWHVSNVNDSLVVTVSMASAVCIIVSATAAVTSAVAATVGVTVSATGTAGAAVAAAASALA